MQGGGERKLAESGRDAGLVVRYMLLAAQPEISMFLLIPPVSSSVLRRTVTDR